MSNDRSIKVINECMCPFCNKTILVSSQMMAPTIDWILKPEDLDGVKEKLKKEIDKIKFKTEKEKEEVLSWLNKKEVLIGPDEFDYVLSDIRNKHVGK